ncbi:MAG: hypothetical protein ABI442_20775 [Gemmatimonadaceae bacterium]
MNIHKTFIAAAVGCTIVSAGQLSAQSTDTQAAPAPKTGWEFLVSSGTVLPTGAERGIIKRANLTAAQLSYVVRPELAVTATLGWARSRDIASIDNPKLDVFAYDLGAEFRSPRWTVGDVVTLSSFAGLGAGARSYNYRSLDVDATHNVSAYASVGGEFGVSRVRVRLEARDYVSGFKPLSGKGSAVTGNDVALMAGLRIVTR